MFWIGWLVLAAVLVLIEMSSLSFYFLLLAGASLAAMALALVGASVWVQLFGFVVVSFILYAAVLPWLRRTLKSKGKGESVELPAQRMIGTTGTVVEAVSPDEAGQVRVNGELWTAVSGESLFPGDHVVVVDVRVTKLVVKRGKEA